MDDWDKLKAELLEDPDTRQAFEERRLAYELASTLIRLRTLHRAFSAVTRR
jgi:hypothetical protein